MSVNASDVYIQVGQVGKASWMNLSKIETVNDKDGKCQITFDSGAAIVIGGTADEFMIKVKEYLNGENKNEST